ncbi:MAG: response regulator, partial [Desulfobacteraceae bacterium]|nr:response regulator [Desulfobacteraceae bacterium]
NIINQKVALLSLKKLGYKVDLVNDGKQAINALEKTKYDLILMDCQMPKMDGFQATGQIRDPESKVLNHKIPIVALTANATKVDETKCLKAGMDDFISKPFNMEILSTVLVKWLSEKHD